MEWGESQEDILSLCTIDIIYLYFSLCWFKYMISIFPKIMQTVGNLCHYANHSTTKIIYNYFKTGYNIIFDAFEIVNWVITLDNFEKRTIWFYI